MEGIRGRSRRLARSPECVVDHLSTFSFPCPFYPLHSSAYNKTNSKPTLTIHNGFELAYETLKLDEQCFCRKAMSSALVMLTALLPRRCRLACRTDAKATPQETMNNKAAVVVVAVVVIVDDVDEEFIILFCFFVFLFQEWLYDIGRREKRFPHIFVRFLFLGTTKSRAVQSPMIHISCRPTTPTTNRTRKKRSECLTLMESQESDIDNPKNILRLHKAIKQHFDQMNVMFEGADMHGQRF